MPENNPARPRVPTPREAGIAIVGAANASLADPTFRDRVRKMHADGASLVQMVDALGLEGVPIIVETHDIRSDQFADLGGPEAAARDHVAEITALKRVSGIVNININEAETIAAEVGPKPTITVLPNWSSRPVYDALHPANGPPVCLFIAGSDARRKGIEEVLAAAAQLQEQGTAGR